VYTTFAGRTGDGPGNTSEKTLFQQKWIPLLLAEQAMAREMRQQALAHQVNRDFSHELRLQRP